VSRVVRKIGGNAEPAGFGPEGPLDKGSCVVAFAELALDPAVGGHGCPASAGVFSGLAAEGAGDGGGVFGQSEAAIVWTAMEEEEVLVAVAGPYVEEELEA